MGPLFLLLPAPTRPRGSSGEPIIEDTDSSPPGTPLRSPERVQGTRSSPRREREGPGVEPALLVRL